MPGAYWGVMYLLITISLLLFLEMLCMDKNPFLTVEPMVLFSLMMNVYGHD